MPIQAPQWTDYLNCPACCREFAPSRGPISLGCGHTLCRICVKNLHRKQCPFDQTLISVDLEELVVNTALLLLAGYTPPVQPYHPACIEALCDLDRQAYDIVVKSLEQLAIFLKYRATNNVSGCRLSRPMQRKLVTLLQCAITDEEGRGKAARAARSLGDRTVTELLVQHQNPQQLSANLWAAVRSRGCQFLGPAMQEEVLKLVLLALEDGCALSRKVLVMFVVQRLEYHFPQASKTSIGHVVQLLYRASCFKLSKRVCDSSLMQLKDDFRSYDTLRREHDAQIVQIATEAGLRIAPDQWSALLYGDTQHKSHMQSIIDKLQTPQSFAQSVQELFITLQRTRDPAQLISMGIPLERLANIDPSPDAESPSWQQLSAIMTALKEVISGLIHFLQHHTTSRDSNHNSKIMERLPEQPNQQTAMQSPQGRYKVAMCRDLQNRVYCPRGNSCTYAHSEEELERYRRNHPVNNGNYQFMMQPPVIAVPLPMYQNFSVPPPPLPNMEHNYNMPPMQQQISPSARRPMVGVDAMNHEQPYEHHDSENVYELGRGRVNSYERHELPCDSTESYEEKSYEPYDRRNQTSYERARDLTSYDRRDQAYDLPPNVSYAEALRQGSEGASRSGGLNQNTPMQHQNGNGNPIMTPAGRHYSRYVNRPAYPYTSHIDAGRVNNDNMSQYSAMSGPEQAHAHARDYPKPPYNDNGPELHFESLTYGMAVPRPLAIQPMEPAWPTNAVKCPPMFQFDKRAKNLPLGMEMGKSIPMNMDIGKNLPIGRDMGSNMSSNMPIGMDMCNNMPIGMDLPMGLPQTNGDMIHHGMEGVRLKPKIRTANENRDDQELEKELKALEKRISTEL